MPIINGYKYSCEPCIRGHRATACSHTDRVLIEVRKPGRPLESCGHGFDTCTCGRLREIGFLMDSIPTNNEFAPEPEVRSMTSPTTATAKSTQAKPRSRAKAKASKRPSSRKNSTISQSESSRKMGESSAMGQAATLPREHEASSPYSPLDSTPSRMWFGASNSTGQGMVPGTIEDLRMESNPSTQQQEERGGGRGYTVSQYTMPGQESWRPMR